MVLDAPPPRGVPVECEVAPSPLGDVVIEDLLKLFPWTAWRKTLRRWQNT